jgi:hypothetical protein
MRLMEQGRGIHKWGVYFRSRLDASHPATAGSGTSSEPAIAGSGPPIDAAASQAGAGARARARFGRTTTKRWAGLGCARIPVPDPMLRLTGWLATRVTDEGWVVLLAALVSVCAYVWYASHGLTLGYGDALSRMMIARRVVSSPTPGLAQLGTTWLPLHTLAMLPLIWNDTLFHDGFAGSFPSMAAYVIASLYMYRIAYFAFTSRAAAWVVALAFMLNPSVTYMQSTAMSEVPLLCAATVAIYYMLRWAKTNHAVDLVKSAAAVAVGTGIRYDGWALAAAFAVLVVYLAWRRQGYRGAEAWGILYGLLAFSGCVAWVIYNAVIFHDPMLFLFFGSAKHDTTYMAHFPSYHSPWLSFEMYGYSAAATAGWMPTLLAVLGLAAFAWRHRLRAGALPAYALLIPFAYHWLILYMGFDTILMPELGLFIYWNARFGLELIPAVTFFLGHLASVRRALLIVSLAVIAWLVVLNSTAETPFALREPLESSTYVPTAQMEASWFTDHYQGGKVLISYVPNAPAMFYMMRDIPDRNFITDANGWEFTHALNYPQLAVTWVIMEENATDNPIWAALHDREELQHYFVLRQVMGTTAFYERIAEGGTGEAVHEASPTRPLSGTDAIAPPRRPHGLYGENRSRQHSSVAY